MEWVWKRGQIILEDSDEKNLKIICQYFKYTSPMMKKSFYMNIFRSGDHSLDENILCEFNSFFV